MERLKKTYYQWLIDTEQFEKAGGVKEKERDAVGAIDFYLKGNMPARAAKLLMNSRDLINNSDLVKRIASNLIKSDLYENVRNYFSIIVKLNLEI